jgi:PAS domain S-box-containing protein
VRRLEVLRDFNLIETAPEPEFDDIAILAAGICETPIALITLVDETRQWFKSKFGLAIDQTPREVAFCAHALHGPDLLEVPDATQDRRFADNALVLAEPKIRFYAGAPLVAPGGEVLGTLCVIDRVPRKLTEQQGRALRVLSRHAMTEMRLRRQVTEHRRATSALLGMMEDQMLTEKALRESEREQREQAALLDKAQDAIIVRDLEDRVLYWNRSAERLYGWTAAEATGRNLADLIKGRTAVLTAARETLLARGEWMGEIEQVTKDGKPVTVEGRWTLVRGDDGSPKSVLAINTDLTERKKLERQFLRAQRMESIGTLAGGIAHDLNNLLVPVVMGVGLLKSAEKNPENLRVIGIIERSAQRGTNLVKQVLSFARGVEGFRVTIRLNDILREVSSIMENTFPKNITLEKMVADDLWLVNGDPTQLNQVLLNLCVNARDAMPGGGTLRIALQNREIDMQFAVMNGGGEAGRYVVIEVADTGTGIPREIIDRIFEPFFTTKELGNGTGLGLSTVMGIVRTHGGFVNVQSQPGKGSVFTVHLPAQNEPAGNEPEAVPANVLPRGHGECVLIVDDETSIVSITQQTLETFGYRVLTAEDGAQAIGTYALHRAEIAVVLTDLMMPVMDGPSLIAALRRINPGVKVIAASGLNSNVNLSKVANAGVKHFLAKPYSADAMLVLLRKVIEEEAG